jgi:peptidyl-prolyl cis-trans isomerase A (cyclophilin A)
MKKIILFLLLACLTACSSNTDTPPADTKPAEVPAPPASTPPAADPAPAAAVPEPTPTPAPAAPAVAPKPEAKAAAKAPDAPAPPPKPTKVLAHFQTSMGNFTAELNEKEAPGTVANFVGLASGEKEWTHPGTGAKQKKPYYDGLIFHRVIDGFMIQGGDPLGTGTGGPGFTIQDEFNELNHQKVGTVAMARTPLPNSAGSQFYINVAPTPGLDGQRPPYVVFGQVIEGLDVVLKIGKTPTTGDRGNPQNRPLTPVTINKVTIERK